MRGTQLCRHGVAASLATHRTAPRTAGRDAATNLNQRNVATAVRRQSDLAAGPPSIGEQQLGLAPGPGPHRLVRLIAVAEPIDQTGGLCLRCGTRTRVDQLADLIMSQPSRIGDGLHRLAEDRLGQPLQGLAMRRCEVLTQQHVGSVLVLVPLLELRLNAEPVQRAAYEGRLDTDAEQPHPPAGLQPQFAETRRQDVRRHVPSPDFTEALRPRQRRLATRGERLYAATQLLHRCPRPHSTDLGDQPNDMPILGRLVQCPQGGTQQPATAGAQSSKRVVRIWGNQWFSQVEFKQCLRPSAGKGSHGVNRRPSPVADRNPSLIRSAT